MKKKIVFVTGTRADYGKIKELILRIQQNKKIFKSFVFVTGMHLIKEYGFTFNELIKDKISNIYKFKNSGINTSPDKILNITISGFSKYLKKVNPDLVVIHGDRIEALGCALAASLRNLKIAHIEGGDVSGNYDEIIRHAVTKFSHIHFVSNSLAKKRVSRLGEKKNLIFNIGSSNIDIIINNKIPQFDQTKKKYNIEFKNYGLAVFHSDENNSKSVKIKTKILKNFFYKFNYNLVVIYPNNDFGGKEFIRTYKKINKKNIKFIESLRFDHYLSLLKNSHFIIGNSSSGIIESPYFGVPTINVGDRQHNRARTESIINIKFKTNELLKFAKNFYENPKKYKKKKNFFGSGNSSQKFIKILKNNDIWKYPVQKYFQD